MALALLKQHQKWRRGDDEMEMMPPRVLGEAIDVVCREAETMARRLMVVANFPSHPGGTKADKSEWSECPEEWRAGWIAAADEMDRRVFGA